MFILFDLCLDIYAVQKVRPFGLSAGRRLLIDRFDVHANRVHKRGFTRPFPPKTGQHRETIDGFDRLRRQLVQISRERVVHRSGQNHRHGFLFRVHVDSSCRWRWCAWELAKMTRRPKRWHHCCRPPHSGKLRRCSCVLSVSVYRAYWKMLGDQGVCGLECCPEPKLQRMTSQCGGIGLISCQTYRSVRYRADVVPILPKCPVPASILYRYRYRLRKYVHTGTGGTGIDVPNLPKCPVPVLMSYRTYRSFRYRY